MSDERDQGVPVWRFVDGGGFNRFLTEDQYVQPNDDPFIAFPEPVAARLIESEAVVAALFEYHEDPTAMNWGRVVIAMLDVDSLRKQEAASI